MKLKSVSYLALASALTPGLPGTYRSHIRNPMVDLPIRQFVRKGTHQIMKKLHIAISTDNVEETVADYSGRLGVQPCSFIRGEYALWRTESLNVSVRQDPDCKPGSLRHLGWEDPAAAEFSQNTDVNGIIWERFTAQHQADEINEIWPEANYKPEC